MLNKNLHEMSEEELQQERQEKLDRRSKLETLKPRSQEVELEILKLTDDLHAMDEELESRGR